MENITANQQPEGGLVITNEIKGYLLETVKWGKFLAIIGFVGLGIMAIVAFFMIVSASMLSEFDTPGMPMVMMGVVYLVMAVLYFFPVNYLFHFSVRTKTALLNTNITILNEGFKNLKSLFRFTGIMMIVILSIYAVILVIGMSVLLFSM